MVAIQTVTEFQASRIMGPNFFGSRSLQKGFGINIPNSQIQTLSRVPFSVETLEASKETHVLILVPKMSVVNLDKKYPLGGPDQVFDVDRPVNCDSPCFQDEGEIGWHLIRKHPIAGLADKTWEELQSLIPPQEKVIDARTMTIAAALCYRETGKFTVLPNEGEELRCSNLDGIWRRTIGWRHGRKYFGRSHAGMCLGSVKDEERRGNVNFPLHCALEVKPDCKPVP